MQANLTQYSGIEDDLYTYFRPIDPDPDFISTLNRRLSRTDQTVLGRPSQSANWLVWIGIGFLAGLATWLIFGGRGKK
jgi:hypothetical protein